MKSQNKGVPLNGSELADGELERLMYDGPECFTNLPWWVKISCSLSACIVYGCGIWKIVDLIIAAIR